MFSILPFSDEAFVLVAGLSWTQGPVEVSGLLKAAVINVGDLFKGSIRWSVTVSRPRKGGWPGAATSSETRRLLIHRFQLTFQPAVTAHTGAVDKTSTQSL